MKLSGSTLAVALRRAVAGLWLGTCLTSALAAPAQLPLLSRDGWEGKPNVVFTLDDSGSMDWQYMPDSVINRFPGPPNAYYVGFDPGESSSAPWRRQNFISTDANDINSIGWRSSHHNYLYYDPEVRYRPWVRQDGTRFPDAPPRAAPLSAITPGLGQVNLEFVGRRRARWCRAGSCRDTTLPYAAATYFQYNGGNDRDPKRFTAVSIMRGNAFVRGAGRTECNVDLVRPSVRICTRTQEMQNFANWFTYYRRRLYTAIGAASEAFESQGGGMRLGYGRINRYSGQIDGVSSGTLIRGVRDFDGQDRSDFFEWLQVQQPTGGTPLREAMGEVGRYFERTDNRGPWGARPGLDDDSPHLECRKSYHILMSDGYWNGASARDAGARANVDGSTGPRITGPGGQSFQYRAGRPYRDTEADSLADVAMYYWYRDLRPDLTNRVKPDAANPAFWQQLVQFTVGLGVGGVLDPERDLDRLIKGELDWPFVVWPAVRDMAARVDDMWHAAVNAKGEFLSARNPLEFSSALGKILQSISERESAEGGAAVSSITLGTEAYKYIPTYRTSAWSGDVQAKTLDPEGRTVGDLWKASEALPAPDARNIVVGTGARGGATAFKWESLTADQRRLLGPNGSEDLVEYLRGDRSKEGGVFRKRDAKSVLGDIVNANPLLVGDLLNEHYQFLPGNIGGGASYRQFLQTKKAREPMLFIGANDGMLHAFRSSDGVETFAYIPRGVISQLYRLAQPAYSHRFYVDGPLVEADAYVGGKWRNYVLGSLGAGGNTVYAIDVTQSDELGRSSVAWEFSHPAMGYVTAPVAVGVARNGRWYAFIGNGYDSSRASARLLVIDLETGAFVRNIDTGVRGDNGLGGVALIKDVNQVVTGVYAGDKRGNLWRFDLSSDRPGAWKVGFGGKPLFVARDKSGKAQPITAAPSYVVHPNGGQLVLFGTGSLYNDADLQQSSLQGLYGIWDRVPGDTESRDSEQFAADDKLLEQNFGRRTTSGDTDYYPVSDKRIDYTRFRGWHLGLTLESGQRMIYTPQLVRGFILFSTVAPTSGVVLPCDDSRANGYNILVNALSGARPLKPVLDTNNDGRIDSKDKVNSVYKTEADGRDAILLGKQGAVSIQRTFGETDVQLNGRGLERTWRQIVNYPRAATSR